MIRPFFICLFFVFFEVLLFGQNPNVQLLISVIEFLALIYVFLFVSKKTAIFYLFSFSLLTLGGINYMEEGPPMNFYGIRFGVSLSIILSFFFMLILLCENPRWHVLMTPVTKFFYFFLVYIFLVGLFLTMFSVNYYRFFLQDLLTYLPILPYVVLIQLLSIGDIKKMIYVTLSVSTFMLLFSLVIDKKMIYAGDTFVLCNIITFFVYPFAVFLLFRSFNFFIRWSNLLFFCCLIVLGSYFISGKHIILLFIFFMWFIARKMSTKNFIFFLLLLFASFFYITNILIFFSDSFQDIPAIKFKFDQILAVFNSSDVFELALEKSSMGNLIAEYETVFFYLKNNLLVLLFGKGMGGTVPDIFGYLAPWAGSSGYPIESLSLNAFYKMHLPLLEIPLKGGLILLIPFLIINIRLLLAKDSIGFLLFISFFMLFYYSKECMLLVLVYDRYRALCGLHIENKKKQE